MRLESLRLQNFRGFEDATLPLDRPLTVLFGENGSGKSSVLIAAVICFSDILSQSFRKKRMGLGYSISDDDIRTGATKATLEVELRQGPQQFSGTLTHFRGSRSNSDTLEIVQDELRRRKIQFLPIAYFSERSVDKSNDIFKAIDTKTEHADEAQWALADTLDPGHVRFRSFFRWFKEREDAENRLKVQQGNLALTDHLLSGVRNAITELLFGFSNLRIQHEPLRLVVSKNADVFAIDQLSDGEKQLLVMTADIARRLSMVYLNEPKPLEQEAVILVDEIELHLHPSWQRRILPAWRRIFPGCQFIVTTHSPQVISEVPNDAVFLVKDFQFIRPGASTEGRDSNSILEETMGTPERPPEIKAELSNIALLIDDERYSEARDSLDKLAQRVTEQDNEVVRLRTMLHFMEGARAIDSQG